MPDRHQSARATCRFCDVSGFTLHASQPPAGGTPPRDDKSPAKLRRQAAFCGPEGASERIGRSATELARHDGEISLDPPEIVADAGEMLVDG